MENPTQTLNILCAMPWTPLLGPDRFYDLESRTATEPAAMEVHRFAARLPVKSAVGNPPLEGHGDYVHGQDTVGCMRSFADVGLYNAWLLLLHGHLLGSRSSTRSAFSMRIVHFERALQRHTFIRPEVHTGIDGDILNHGRRLR